MSSRLRRTSYLARLAPAAGIGALAIVTGACSSGGEANDADSGASTDAPVEEVTEAESDSDSGASTDAPATSAAPAEPAIDSDVVPAEGETASTDSEGSTDTE
ncbi:MAG: hypothetical protein RLN87_02650 [Parasphingopyxis sp.]|uniref:hypothetical protein n=1 Tax=Parasphingopyxis sp. TaxID=1920299 RepID=UPI00261A04EB|nr:hypothetical protein [uncultured Parasphingopyxis sp.]